MKKTYRVMAYYRLSKEDRYKNRYKNESDSIVNQKKLIHEYIARHDNLVLVDEKEDDGYTGTNYDRPGFRAVMEAIENGTVDCVIVKDLSRLGREYIETGKYLEMVFPALGVRFIAVNDDVDSENHSQSDDILIPVKNIMNETYCRDLSKKLRSQFKVQRGNGEFLGAFASYGYCKSPDDKHKLVVDEFAAEVVRGIFSMSMQGYSIQAIADSMNTTGILSPAEYKRQQGLRYYTGFARENLPQWNASTVRNILKNPVYIGHLVQGKRGTPNYKIKKIVERDESGWIVVKHNHEPIVDELVFNLVQQMLQRDTRTPPNAETVRPLAGILFCADCGRAMCRRSVTRGKKKFHYYVCSTNKHGQGCSSHSFPQGQLETVVLHAIQKQIQLMVEMDQLLREIARDDLQAVKCQRLERQIIDKQKEIDGHREFRMRLLEALNENLIDRDEYNQMRAKYTLLIETAQEALSRLKEEQNQGAGENDYSEQNWLDQFLRYRNIQELTRDAVVSLIKRIDVYEDRHLHIEFNFQNDMASCQQLLAEAVKEAG